MNIKLFHPVYLALFFLSCSSTPASNVDLKINHKPVEQKTTPVQPSIPLDYLMGKFDPAKDQRFVLIDKKYADREGLMLRKETYEAFLKLWEAAKNDGLHFTILSATRNFDYQKGIWERKWKGTTKVGGNDLSKTIPDPKMRAQKILEYSSMPGTSRHHWGTDLDVNAFENDYFESGKGLAEYEWLVKNAASFGFCQPYTPKDINRPYGYNEEKWHWSYMPLSKTFTQQAELHLKDKMINGFDGAESAIELQVIKHFVLGINTACKI